jgi:hypothetical protein
MALGRKVRTYNKYLGIPPSDVEEDDIERDPDIEEGPDKEEIRKRRKAGGLAPGSLPTSRQDRPSRARRGLAGGGRLTAAARQKLPSSEFARPGKGTGPKGAGPGSYPLPDKKHGRIALSLVSQHGTPAEKAEVRSAVHRKFPDIGQD